MIIPGRFIGDGAYFAVHLQARQFEGILWLMADTGASRTTLLDRDVKFLNIPVESLAPSELPIVGIGGSVRSFHVPEVEMTFASDKGDVTFSQDLWIVQHDLKQLPAEEVGRILRLPSVLGRDVMNQYRLYYDYHAGVAQLEK